MATTVTCTARATSPNIAKVNTNVSLAGTHEYTIINTDDKELAITIEVIIQDSLGRMTQSKDPFVVQPNSTFKNSVTTHLVTLYDKKQHVIVTAKTTIDGDVFCSESSGNGMDIID